MACCGVTGVLVIPWCSLRRPLQQLYSQSVPLLQGLTCAVPHMLSKGCEAVPHPDTQV